MKTLRIITGIIIFILLLEGCRKSEIYYGKMKVNLTDAPANYEHVFIDLQKVVVHYNNTPEDKWIELRSNPGIYDLLALRNDVKVVIAEDQRLPLGKISQIRLVLGDSNSVVDAGIKYTLKVPGSSTSGLKINVHQTIKRNDFLIVTLDFDAEASVKVKGVGEYIMEPVIKVKEIVYN